MSICWWALCYIIAAAAGYAARLRGAAGPWQGRPKSPLRLLQGRESSVPMPRRGKQCEVHAADGCGLRYLTIACDTHLRRAPAGKGGPQVR